MSRDFFNLRYYLLMEAENVISTTDRQGGVLDYTLKNFAYNAVLRRYPENRRGERFDIKDIICAQTNFITLKSVIRQIDWPITPQTYQAIGTQLYYGVPVQLTEQMSQFILRYSHEPSDCDPNPLREVAELHSGYVKLGGDSRTAEIVSFLHCLNLYTMPLFIHADNSERYKAAVMDPAQLLELFQEEQERYRAEIQPFLRKNE